MRPPKERKRDELKPVRPLTKSNSIGVDCWYWLRDLLIADGAVLNPFPNKLDGAFFGLDRANA